MLKLQDDGLDVEIDDLFSLAAGSFDTAPAPDDAFHAGFPTASPGIGFMQQQRFSPSFQSHDAGMAQLSPDDTQAFGIGQLQPTAFGNSWTQDAAANGGAVQPLDSYGMRRTPRSTAAAAASSANLMNDAAKLLPPPSFPSAVTLSPGTLAPSSLSNEQQQRLYADFVAGRHMTSLTGPLQYQTSLPHSGAAPASASKQHSAAPDDMSSAGENSDEDDAPPAKGRRGSRNVKQEHTPSSAAQHSPYVKPLGVGADPNVGDDVDGPERLGARLARKAELARASRRRKKAYIQDLEAKVKRLTVKIEELQQAGKTVPKAAASAARIAPAPAVPHSAAAAPLALVAAAEEARAQEQKSLQSSMADLLHKTEAKAMSPPLASARIDALAKQFLENSQDRQKQLEQYFDKVEAALKPGLQAQFAMWGLDQDESFYSSDSGLWSGLLIKEIGLSEAQLQRVLAARPAIQAERRNMAACENMIKQLRVAADSHLKQLHSAMNHLTSCMTPLQLAKFYTWVQSHAATMKMLDAQMTSTSLR